MDADDLHQMRSSGDFQRSLRDLGGSERSMGGMSAKETRALGESFERWGNKAMAAGALVGLVEPPIGVALGGAGATSALIGDHLKTVADEKQAREDAEMKRANEALRRYQEAKEIKDHPGDKYRDLDRGQTSRNDLGDRMDRAAATA